MGIISFGHNKKTLVREANSGRETDESASKKLEKSRYFDGWEA